ncbi:MAG: translation initiation factor 2 [Desulfovibrio sp.]|nr:translation initiation factor 2 [Desulfovibrio sp.]
MVVVLLAFCTVQGNVDLTAGGVAIDSDLATYAQGMAREANPELFTNDPLLHAPSAGNSIVNMQRALATLLAFGAESGVSLLRSCGVILVFFAFFWYLFGRYLFGRRDFALLLLVSVSITVWVGFGTFWGITHSDPLPRVMHAAFWPLMLWLGIAAYDRPLLRPLCLLCSGLGMWLHGVSSLNSGAMFLAAFFFNRPKGLSLSKHLGLFLLCVLAFLGPVLIFLWPSLGQAKAFSPAELALFAEFFKLRWAEDYGDLGGSLLKLVNPLNSLGLLFWAGLMASFLVARLDNHKLQALAKMYPSFLLAIACVCLFSWLETSYAAFLGRVPMGHELVRGVKFVVPLSWIFLVGLLVHFLTSVPKIWVRCLVVLSFVLLFLCSYDKQYLALQHKLGQNFGLTLPLTNEALAFKNKAWLAREAVLQVKARTREGEVIFCLEDLMMALRFVAQRPLAYSFKDGYAYFYSKDFEGSRQWLNYTKLVQSGKDGLARAFELSGAKWYLANKAKQDFLPGLTLVWQNAAWALYKSLD